MIPVKEFIGFSLSFHQSGSLVAIFIPPQARSQHGDFFAFPIKIPFWGYFDSPTRSSAGGSD